MSYNEVSYKVVSYKVVVTREENKGIYIIRYDTGGNTNITVNTHVKKWLYANNIKNWRYDDRFVNQLWFIFDQEEDAMAFKLRWL